MPLEGPFKTIENEVQEVEDALDLSTMKGKIRSSVSREDLSVYAVVLKKKFQEAEEGVEKEELERLVCLVEKRMDDLTDVEKSLLIFIQEGTFLQRLENEKRYSLLLEYLQICRELRNKLSLKEKETFTSYIHSIDNRLDIIEARTL
ncbi:MAG: hypothetical protein ABII02_03150 [Candidatus Magasanikbacteria bacterium]